MSVREKRNYQLYGIYERPWEAELSIIWDI